jgi:hypothetical protein
MLLLWLLSKWPASVGLGFRFRAAGHAAKAPVLAQNQHKRPHLGFLLFHLLHYCMYAH